MIQFGVEFYDPGLLFDDDGCVYVVHGANGLSVTELTADARGVKSEPVSIYETAFGTPLEGSHIFKRDGWYYLCVTSRGYNGMEICLRSRTIYGPYEARVVCADDMNYAGAGLHQGGFVELENGETWFFLFQDRDYVGRVPVLQPVQWVDGWPVLGDAKNFGKAVVTCKKPSVQGRYPVSIPEQSDDFDETQLGLQWQWNHNPDSARWSLSERTGWLRLRPSQAPDLLHARNTLTQKIYGPSCIATTCLDFSGLVEGDLAGIAVQNIPYAFIGIHREQGVGRLVMVDNGCLKQRSDVQDGQQIYLRVSVQSDGLARFSYGFNGIDFMPFGEPFLMQFTVKTFLGNRFGLFSFNQNPGTETGLADFDFLRFDPLQSANYFSALDWIPATAYDAEHGTDTQRPVEKQPQQYLVNLNEGDWIRFDQIDFGSGTDRFKVRASAVGCGGRIELRLEGADGPLIGVCAIAGNGNRDVWNGSFAEYECPVLQTYGVHPLHLRFVGPGRYIFRLASFIFSNNSDSN